MSEIPELIKNAIIFASEKNIIAAYVPCGKTYKALVAEKKKEEVKNANNVSHITPNLFSFQMSKTNSVDASINNALFTANAKELKANRKSILVTLETKQAIQKDMISGHILRVNYEGKTAMFLVVNNIIHKNEITVSGTQLLDSHLTKGKKEQIKNLQPELAAALA
jgi:hypothetical protein